MKIKQLFLFAAMALCTPLMAQKSLTLNDLLGGGNNYYNLRAETKYTQWWGNTPIETTPDEAKNLLTGETIVSVEQVLSALQLQGKGGINGHYFSFPYADKPVVRTSLGRRCIEVDFKTGEVVLDCMLPERAANTDFTR